MTEVIDSQDLVLQKLNQLLKNQAASTKLTETISQKVETNEVDFKAMKVDFKDMKDVVEKLAKEVSKQNKSFSDTREIIFRYEKKQGG